MEDGAAEPFPFVHDSVSLFRSGDYKVAQMVLLSGFNSRPAGVCNGLQNVPPIPSLYFCAQVK